MSISDTITELADIWYEYVGCDHHKDRDCHFWIEKKWSYGKPATYQAHHHGYIAPYWESKIYDRPFEAEKELEEFLRNQIQESLYWVKRNLDDAVNGGVVFNAPYELEQMRLILERVNNVGNL